MKLILSPNYSYSQKPVIRNWVMGFIKTYDIHSLLDIGAGFPETALAFKNSVGNYIAIERNKHRSDMLKNSGIEVRNLSFPSQISGFYDLVLISHSLPENPKNYERFLTAAWKVVSNNGYMIIITFKGICDDMSQIRSELKKTEPVPFEQHKFDALTKVVKKLSRTYDIVHLVSTEMSSNYNDIAQSIASSLKYRYPVRTLRSIVKLKLLTKSGYILEHKHNIIIMHKNKRYSLNTQKIGVRHS